MDPKYEVNIVAASLPVAHRFSAESGGMPRWAAEEVDFRGRGRTCQGPRPQLATAFAETHPQCWHCSTTLLPCELRESFRTVGAVLECCRVEGRVLKMEAATTKIGHGWSRNRRTLCSAWLRLPSWRLWSCSVAPIVVLDLGFSQLGLRFRC